MEVDYARRVRDAAYICQCASSGFGTKSKCTLKNYACRVRDAAYIHMPVRKLKALEPAIGGVVHGSHS